MEISPHQLFNKLSNLFPMLCVDCRPAPDFAACHLKDAMNAPDCLLAGGPFLPTLEDCMAGSKVFLRTRPFFRSKTFLVLVVQEVDREVVGRALQGLKKDAEGHWQWGAGNGDGGTSLSEMWTCILDIHFVCFEAFLHKYRLCSALFPPDTSQTAQVRTRLPYASEVIPDFLFLGDFDNGSNPNQLRSLRITHVVDASGARLSQETTTALGLAYLPVDLWDSEDADITAFFPQSNDFIATAQGTEGARVLVHCRAGISRSPSLVLAYLLHRCGTGGTAAEPAIHLPTDLRGAVEWLVLQRPIVCPNAAFRDQLRRYEVQLLRRSSLEDDNEFLALIEAHNQLWCAHFGSGTDFDSIPITAALAKNKGSTSVEEFLNGLDSAPCAQQAEGCLPPKKRPFLKKGTGATRKQSAR